MPEKKKPNGRQIARAETAIKYHDGLIIAVLLKSYDSIVLVTQGRNRCVVVVVVVLSHELIRYESSRGHKIDGTKPNQTGNRR